MSALTHSEAQARAHLLKVHSYRVVLDLTRCAEDGAEVFGSSTTIRFACAEPGAETFAQLRAAAVRRVVLNGRELPASADGGRILLTGLLAENELLVEADMRYSRTGEGMHRFVDPADGETYVYTMCGPDEASRVFACFDQPDLKAALEISVAAPEHWTVLSNGAGLGSGGHWEFAATPPLSTYLAAVVGGPLHSVRAEHDGIPLGLHCRRSIAAQLDADELFDITRRSFDRMHELFDERYAFGKYDQAFLPEFNFGAVENPGCVIFRDEFLYRSAATAAERGIRTMVIAHEMAHMWFGDLVTMRWWDDLWLSESFAEYVGYQVITDTRLYDHAWTGFAISRKPQGYDADQRPSTHPVAADSIEDTSSALAGFDSIAYAKGASALRQLVTWVGDDAFFAGVNDYIARHRFGNAELADLLECLTRASGRDVHGWAGRWLRTTGMNTLCAEPDAVVRSGEPRPHRILVGAYDLADGRLVRRERAEVDLTGERTGMARLDADLLLANDGDLSYAKVRLNPRSWRAAADALSTVEDPLSRALLWSVARDMVRDAELPPGDFLTLVRDHLPAEPVVATVEAVLTFAKQQAIDRYTAPAAQPDALRALAGVCVRLRDGSDDADLRLAAVRWLIPCSGEELGEWLHGEPDQELRWRGLLRLSALGVVGEPGIAAELERDPSAKGREEAAQCRAARPGAANKEEAWRLMFSDGALSNHLVTATARGFWQSPADFVDRYFAEIPAAARRGPTIAGTLGRDLFPAHAATPETVRAAEACLARDDLGAPLRRALADQLDDLRRSTRIRG